VHHHARVQVQRREIIIFLGHRFRRRLGVIVRFDKRARVCYQRPKLFVFLRNLSVLARDRLPLGLNLLILRCNLRVLSHNNRLQLLDLPLGLLENGLDLRPRRALNPRTAGSAIHAQIEQGNGIVGSESIDEMLTSILADHVHGQYEGLQGLVLL